MDEDVIIARMGGKMESGGRSGETLQVKDHDNNDMQPQSVMRNIALQNPLVIICGNKNASSPTKMPQRYCVLDWFKATHVWAEMTLGRGGKPRTTIKYRFERLDRSQPSWYGPSEAPLTTAQQESIPPLKKHTCQACGKESPRAFVTGWMCLQAECKRLWKLPNGRNASCDELDYHPSFLRHETRWQVQEPPFSVDPGVPNLGQYFGDNLLYVGTRGIVCPKCGRCNARYQFVRWKCDTTECDWSLTPVNQTILPGNLHHTPWDISSDGPGLVKITAKPVIDTQIRHSHNYKILKYTIAGIDGCIIHAKANKRVVEESGGPNDMFRALQQNDIGLERRVFKSDAPMKEGEGADEKEADVPESDTGARMVAFSMNFGMPYKFVASGSSRAFADADWSVRACRSRLNWALRTFLGVSDTEEEFNELLALAYMEDQKIKYHDDGEEGLGPRIATLSLGGAARMSLRLKAKSFSGISKTGIFTDEKPLPLRLLESSGYVQGSKSNARSSIGTNQTKDTWRGRMNAYDELQALRAKGERTAFLAKSRELGNELELKRRNADPVLSLHLTHGDIVMMEGEAIQKYFEHQVEPHGCLRFALTCRRILPHHLKEDQVPAYNVEKYAYGYDGLHIKQHQDGEVIQW